MLLARRFSDHAGLALEQLERREAEDEAARRALETRRLLDSTAALAAAATPAEVTNAILAEGLRSLGAVSGVVVTVTEDGDALELVDSHGYRPETIAPWTSFPLDADVPLAKAARDNVVVAIESPEELEVRYPGARERSDRDDRVVALAAAERRRIGSRSGRLLVLAPACVPGGESSSSPSALARQSSQALERARLLAAEYAAQDAGRGARRPDERAERGCQPVRRRPRGARAAPRSCDGGRSRRVRPRERRRSRARRAGGERARLGRRPEQSGVGRELASGGERPRATAHLDRPRRGLGGVRGQRVVAGGGHRRPRARRP